MAPQENAVPSLRGEISMITYHDYKMADETTVQLSVGMAQLFKLKKKNKEAFEVVNNVLMGRPIDVTEIALFIYGAYICANGNENVIKLDEFLANMNQDVEENAAIVLEVSKPKKK